MPQRGPLLHVTGMVPAERGCIALVWPLAIHPTNKNEVIVWDLAQDPAMLQGLSADDIRLRMFSKADALPQGVTRLPIKTIHVNKSPIVINNLKILSPEMAQRWQIDLDTARQHAQVAATLLLPDSLWQQVFQRVPDAPVDVDEDLYGGFVGNNDRRLLTQLRAMTPARMAAALPRFDDERLDELVFRYRARNFSDTLTDIDAERWDQHRAARLFDGSGGTRTIEQLFDEIDQLSETVDERGEHILGALYDYAEAIAPARR